MNFRAFPKIRLVAVALTAAFFWSCDDNPSNADPGPVVLLKDIGDITAAPLSSVTVALALDANQLLTCELLDAGPAGAQVSNGNFTWTPRFLDLGKTFNVRVKATGAGGVSDTTSFSCTVGYSATQKDSLADLLEEMKCFKLIYPLDGETFAYGDTLAIVFVNEVGICPIAVTQMSSDGGIYYGDLQQPEQAQFNFIDQPYGASDPRMYLQLDGQVWLGLYRQVIADTTIEGERITFNGSEMKAAVNYLYIQDHHPEYQGFDEMKGEFAVTR